MGAAVTLRNIVGEAEHGLLVGIGPRKGRLDRDVVLLGIEGDHVGMQRGLELGQVLDEGADAAFMLEGIVLVGALVDQPRSSPRNQEAQLAQASLARMS